MGWKTDSSGGLISGYYKDIEEAFFAKDDRRGPNLQLHLIGPIEMADGSDLPDGMDADEHLDMLSCGKGWQSDDGEEASHGSRVEFHASSQVGVFIDRLAECAGEDGIAVLETRDADDPTESGAWVGLRVLLERVKIPLNNPMTVTDDDGTKRTIKEYEQVVPTELVSIDGEAVGGGKPKKKKGKKAAAEEPEDEEPEDDGDEDEGEEEEEEERPRKKRPVKAGKGR